MSPIENTAPSKKRKCEEGGKPQLRIALGCALPTNAYSGDGLLLLARGELIESIEQVHRLLQEDVVFADKPPDRRLRGLPRKKQDAWGARAPLEEEIDLEAPAELQLPPEPHIAAEEVPVKAELAEARAIRAEAIQRMEVIVEEVQAGRPVDIDSAETVVGELFGSLHRNARALMSLVRLKEMDRYTYTHSVNTCILSIILAKACGIKEGLEALGLGALLHDIGKLWVPVEILRKGCELDEADWELVRRHPVFGMELVGQSRESKACNMAAIGEHHERVNGSGYPRRLDRSALSVAGRIVSVADVYDALTSDRPYRRRFSPPEAMRMIAEGAGEYFDLVVARAFIGSVGIFPIGSLVRLSNSELAVVSSVNPKAMRRPVVLVISDEYGMLAKRPQRLDLAKISRPGDNLEIVGVEEPRDFEVEVEDYLGISSDLEKIETQVLDYRV